METERIRQYELRRKIQEDDDRSELQQHLVDAPVGPRKANPTEILCSKVFCHAIADEFAVVLGARPDKQGRHERKMLFVWHYPHIAQAGNEIFRKLLKKDTLVAQSLSSPDPKYICMACHSLNSAMDPDRNRGENQVIEQVSMRNTIEFILKVAAATLSSLDVWHIIINCGVKGASAEIASYFTVPLTNPSTSLVWSEDGACIFSAQRSKIMIWDDSVNRIASIGYSDRNVERSDAIFKLIYLQRPKEVIVAVYESGLIYGWFLEEGSLCLVAMVTSVTGKDLSRGVPYQRKDSITEIQITPPSVSYSTATTSSVTSAGKTLVRRGNKGLPQHVGHILVSTTTGSLPITEPSFCTIVACFQSGRMKKLEIEIFAPGTALDDNQLSRVREVASVDLQRELRYRQSSLPSAGEDVMMKREQSANILSVTALVPQVSSQQMLRNSSIAGSSIGYLALLGDSILILNHHLVVLDMITTGFKGLISLGSINTVTVSIPESSPPSSEIFVEAVAISALTSNLHAVFCPLRYFLNSATGTAVEGLASLAAQLSLDSSRIHDTSSSQLSLEASSTKNKSSIPKPRASSISKSRHDSLSVTANMTTNLQNSSQLQVDVVDLDFFASLPASPSSPLDDDANEGESALIENDGSRRVTRRKSMSLLASPDSSTMVQVTQTLQKQQQLKRTLMKGDWEKPLKDAQGRLINQPVTFHSRIKSSGYGQQPQDLYSKKMLQRQKEKEKQAKMEKMARSNSAPRIRGGQMGKSENAGGGRLRLYPLQCQAMQSHLPVWDYPDKVVAKNQSSSTQMTSHNSPMFHLVFSSDATRLAVASASSVALCLRLPRATSLQRDVVAYMGHNHALQTVCLSHFKQPEYLLLSSCKDETSRMWRLSRSEQASVLMSHQRHQPSTEVAMTMHMSVLSSTSVTATAATSASTSKKVGGAVNLGTNASSAERNRPFGCEIKQAQFFYQDRFVLLSHRSNVSMFSYQLDSSDSSSTNTSGATYGSRHHTSTTRQDSAELTRFLHHGTYRRKHVWEFTAAQTNSPSSVTALAAMNSVQSPLILAATSDKRLHILDANCGRILRSIPQAHDKAVSCLSVSQPSPHAPLPRDAHQVFLSLAPDNVACLWDLRQATAVMRYTQHVNRREVVYGNFSPCMKYFGVGSEDGTARLFDIVAGKEAAVLTGHRDVVTCVAFNPLFAQIATCSYDGTVRFYADSDCPLYTSSSMT